MRVRSLCRLTLAIILGLSCGVRGAEQVLITEFMALNTGPLADEDGEFSDWIEVHNPGTNEVNLNGWFLTDRASQLTQWRFPSTNLPPNGYLIVFASGKDRRVPGAPLHTSFRLSGSGEYLALVRPDGTTVASAFAPLFPVQANGVSYGIPLQQTVTTLVASGATARLIVPWDDSFGSAWTGPLFGDGDWAEVPTGVGYETDGLVPFQPVMLADSVAEFSGTQGQNNWFYGYWDKGNDADGVYQDTEFVAFPNDGGPFGAGNYWTGSYWNWFGGDPPYTELTRQGGRPAGNGGSPGNPSHWAVRRYICETNGLLNIRGTLTHTNANEWVYVTETGVAANSLLYMYLTAPGDGYVDEMKLVAGATPGVGANLLSNPDFETSLSVGWNVSANMADSTITTTPKHSGLRGLHIVATSGGSSQSSSIWQSVSPTLTVGQIYTLSYWYLPGANSAPLVVRFSGSWIDTQPGPCGDGVVGRIFVDGVPVYQQAAVASSANFQVTVPARVGSKVDFALDAGPAGEDTCDNAAFTATIDTADSTITVVADSVADWSTSGTQGEKSWFYGYYDRSADPDRTYQPADFRAFPRDGGPPSPSNFWDEEEWDWFSGNPPFDRIGQYWMTPNGTNSGAHHWVIRRWVSEVNGTVSLEWGAFKGFKDQYHLGGNGVTIRILQNGTQRDVVALRGNDVFGVQRTISLTNVLVGDLIDLVLDPTNQTDGRPDDDQDPTVVTAVMRGTQSLAGQANTDLEGAMRGINATAYLRFPFTVADPTVFNSLTLRLKYDDGFIAYLNGAEVARANAPMLSDWSSQALAARSDADAREFAEFSLGASLGLLRAGANVLAIHGLNAAADDGDFLILPELLATSEYYPPSTNRYFSTPTPGTANGLGNTSLGPLIFTASHTPAVPRDDEALAVTATVAPTFYPLDSVRLIYRVMYSSEVSAPMFDDGLHGDGAAGDGTWGASIPASASSPGQMVRYYIYASDLGANGSRFPAYEDPKNSPQYQGTVVINPALTNPLPVLHMFVQNPTLATNYVGTRCSVFWDDEFFDNIEVNAHGQTTWYVFPKRSMDFNLNTGHKLRWKRGEERVKAFDLLSTYADRAYLRLVMAFETFRDAGVPTHNAFAVRVQQNNAFHSVMHWVEQANDDFLARNGLDPEGALYKVYFPLTNAYAGVKKETRKNEPNDDLQALIDGLSQTGPALRQYLFDNLDVPEVVNFFATIEVVQNEDCCYYKNYYLHRESNGNGEWRILPWDLDLVFGRTFTGWVAQTNQVGAITNYTGGYFDTSIYATNKWFSELRASHDFIGYGQPLFEALWAIPEAQNMFLRRWTTVQEEFLQKTNTHPLALKFERRVDELAAQIAPDAALDLALWGTWWPSQNLAQAVSLMKNQYSAPRRGWIFNTLAFANGGPYLGTQPTNATVLFGDIEFNPASGNQNQEYVQLRNTNNYSIDISGWKLAGAAEFTFRGGTVIPSNGVLYVSPDVNAFRARTSGPRGGQGLFVQGNYQGQLSAHGEALQLADQSGRTVAATNYTGAPSAAQQYLRITELMYHPELPPPGLATNADEFEYIELKNIGPTPLSLVGVRFVNGIEFTFTAGGPVTSLAAGEAVVLVRNVAAFTSRYGGSVKIAGAYTGALENDGENVRLEDASGEKILDFSYNNAWFPITDGLGFSLVIVDEAAPWDTWGLKPSWRPSGSALGSPGQPDPAPAPLVSVVINEILSHTDPPLVDAIELFNPTPFPAAIGGWYISDDFATPKKFRIPDWTVIDGYGYWVFDETDFNRTNPPSPSAFAFSSQGDEAYLFSADATGELTGYFHGFAFGAAANGVSFGRHLTSGGAEEFVAQSRITLWTYNAGPRVGPVVITEIMYHPPDLPDGQDNADDEYVELRNVSGSTVQLYDPLLPDHTWRLHGGLDLDLPPGVMLNPGEFLLLVNFEPSDAVRLASFRSKFNVPTQARVLGPFSGKLDNSADNVRLSRPDAPEAGEVPYILIDEVEYADAAPWPAGADGTGASLQRRDDLAYGNDSAHWAAATPTAGRAGSAGAPPVIVAQPAGTNVAASGNVALAVQATGAAPLRYQWRFNGVNLVHETNAALTLTNVQLSQAGSYDVAVFNATGSTLSSNAFLEVVLGPYFTQQPTNITVGVGGNAFFSARAVSSSTIRYQWRRNGVNLSGGTNSVLGLNNVQPSDAGLITVMASDAVTSLESAPALLTVAIPPRIVLHPASQTVVTGSTVTLSVVVTNTATLPILYRWRASVFYLPGGSFLLNDRSHFFTITNAQPTFTAYSVVVSNGATPSGLASSTATLTFVTDTDGDGLPDTWEATYFGATGANPGDDSDGDGLTNWEEYVAGTEPGNPLSYLKIDSLTPGSPASVVFAAVSNRTYTVEFTDALQTGPWLKLGDLPAHTTNRVASIGDPQFSTNRYYRLVTPRQP